MIRDEFDLSISDETWIEFNALRMAFIKAEREYRRDQSIENQRKADSVYRALRRFMTDWDIVLWPFLIENDNLYVIEGGKASLGE